MTQKQPTTTPLTAREVNAILAEEPGHLFRLDELAQVNLFDLQLPFLGAQHREAPLCVQHHREPEVYLQLNRPSEIEAVLRERELDELVQLLREREHIKGYAVKHFRPGYFKGQTEWLASLELDADYYLRGASVTLVDFGTSYGKVSVNGFLVDISHSGGSGPAGSHTWVDYATGLHFVGRNRVQALRSLIVGEAG